MPPSRRPRPASKPQAPRAIDAIYRQRLAGLVRTHARLTHKLAFITEQIRALERELGVKVPDRAPAQTRQPRTLPDTIAQVLTRRPMSTAEVAQAVRDRGYISFSKNFQGMVTTALARDKRFTRVGPGRYAAK